MNMQTRTSTRPDEIADTQTADSSSPLSSHEKSPPEKDLSLSTINGLDHAPTAAKRPSDAAQSEQPTKKARGAEEWPEFKPPET